MDLIIDVGNTRVKAAVFENDTIVDVVIFEKKELISETKKILKKYAITGAIISAVATLTKEKLQELHQILDVIELNHETKVPFKNNYTTPKTLGVDRIALAAYAMAKHSGENTLIIDAGTCITFDFVNADGMYLGGAISPGLKMRYQSLNNYTSKLPLLTTEMPKNFIGDNTNNCMHSGVVYGICNEIDGTIERYRKKFTDLTVVLTGGDTNFLANQLKNYIFANPNSVLEGLHKILIYNRADD